MKRESGYYWVKLSTTWVICFWDKARQFWYMAGKYGGLTSDYFTEIDERKIEKP